MNSTNSNGHVYLYHNVSIGIGQGTKAYHFPPPDFSFENKVAKNNIFVFSSNEATNSGQTEFDNDYNCYYRYGKNKDFKFKFNMLKKEFSLNELQQSLAREVNGIAGEPGFKSAINITVDDIIDAYKTDKIIPLIFH